MIKSRRYELHRLYMYGAPFRSFSFLRSPRTWLARRRQIKRNQQPPTYLCRPSSRVLEKNPDQPRHDSVIAVVQLINKQGKLLDGGGRDSCTGMHFTSQDVAVIGAFLSLLGPHIFKSSMLHPKRTMNIRVSGKFFEHLMHEHTCIYMRMKRVRTTSTRVANTFYGVHLFLISSAQHLAAPLAKKLKVPFWDCIVHANTKGRVV